ncbi:hypothetical protein E3P77_03778 [Wallemia ichthyophaga]|uniref:Uncharacterized protein n=1 Tax=Wallemia ichthyophaga TaxID=245174 RepID=A0A4T0GZ31_WALIC|nr:hypothetical protein E3P91_04077 [Wallemia ichthyophaga]TIB07113.1 hypothetical protein E3P93_04019 [Wallemia ichthyophaga]TIB07622.1 hypothetical protein E3P90_04016 [Wallemia ichthyophaga]TIB19393.1 hypothetical protein E3P89_04010 [Wallemia ichthyophaga]TIB20171.1 hypothetical protein E3P88_04022 [Wallemia ichthyophaga]
MDSIGPQMRKHTPNDNLLRDFSLESDEFDGFDSKQRPLSYHYPHAHPPTTNKQNKVHDNPISSGCDKLENGFSAHQHQPPALTRPISHTLPTFLNFFAPSGFS